MRPPGSDPNDEAWHKLITYVTALDYSARFQFAHTGHELVMLLNVPRRDPEVGIKVTTDDVVGFRYRMDVSHRLNQFPQGAVGLRNHVGKLLDVRATISTVEPEVTTRLSHARREHVSAGPTALVYALSNVFRHELVPDTIILEKRWEGSLTESRGFDIRTVLGMGGLIGDKGWSKSADEFASANDPVDLLRLAETYRHGIRNLVEFVATEVRAEAVRRYRTQASASSERPSSSATAQLRPRRARATRSRS